MQLMNIGNCGTIGEMEFSQVIGAPAKGDSGVDDAVVREGGFVADTRKKVEKVEAAEISLGKPRRGRPPRSQAKTTPQPRKKRDEEDVCFICFDGGSLVLCDRRGCPKAYHPACIKRDEAFFRSKAKWNCGWHLCNSCQKESHYLCYTCTYSLCKGCTKDADYLRVRGSKGLCGTCMRTIMMMEKSVEGNKELVEVDFDDKSSFEYLFKMYWVYLKAKLSLSLDELSRAKNPWEGNGYIAGNGEPSVELCGSNDCKGSGSDTSGGGLKVDNSKRKLNTEVAYQLNGRMNKSSWRGRKAFGSVRNQLNPTHSVTDSGKQVFKSEVSLSPYFVGIEHSINDVEADSLWHYQDPAGKIQGPFSMMQLHKWSTNGLFPLDLRVWRTSQLQADSVLLTHALDVHFNKELPFTNNGYVSQEVKMGVNNDDHPNAPNVVFDSSKEHASNIKSDTVAWTAPSDVVNLNEDQTGSCEQGLDSLKDKSSWYNQHHSSNPPTLPPKPELSNQGIDVCETERSSTPSTGKQNSNKSGERETNSGHSHENLSDSKDYCGTQKDGQNLRSPTLVISPHDWVPSILVSLAKSTEAAEKNREVVIPDLPIPSPMTIDGDLKGQAVDIRQSASSSVPFQDSGPSWGTASSFVGRVGRLLDAAAEWGGYSHMTSKPSVNDQRKDSSSSHPTSNASSWQEFADEPNEFNSLVDESVSDLLAEVEAMECLSSLASPTSIIKCGDELTLDSKNDCFSFIGGLNPTPEMEKGDALSSTSDLHFSQSMVTDDLHLTLGAVFDNQRRLDGHLSANIKVEGDTKTSEISGNQPQLSLNMMSSRETSWRTRSETTDTSWGSDQGNANVVWEGLNLGNTNAAWGICSLPIRKPES